MRSEIEEFKRELEAKSERDQEKVSYSIENLEKDLVLLRK